MAITCEWKHKLGKATKYLSLPSQDIASEISIYGGGNVMFVACYEHNKELYCFAIDKKHAKNFIDAKTLDLKDIEIYIHDDKHINKEAKEVAKLFIDLGIEFTYKYIGE